MSLRSNLFSGDPALEACQVQDSAHITQGAVGDHVSKIHTALLSLDGFEVEISELRRQLYGPSTAAGVLAYKRKRNIINFSYQTTADNIVGKMTITAMDNELFRQQNSPTPPDFESSAWSTRRSNT